MYQISAFPCFEFSTQLQNAMFTKKNWNGQDLTITSHCKSLWINKKGTLVIYM